jgi:hypothetical protein
MPKPPRIPVKLGDGTPSGVSIGDISRAAGLDRTAKLISEGLAGNAAFKATMDRVVESANRPIKQAMEQIAKDFDVRAAALQGIQRDALSVRSLTPELALLPSPEVSASRAIEAQTSRLVDISIRTSEQIAQLAQLMEAALEQQVQGVLTAAQMREDARRSARTLNVLTIAIVLLTAALVLDALKIWPFGAA